jgi:hypothetical protein
MNSKIVAGVLVAVTLVIFFVASTKTQIFGASTGQAHFQTESFLQGLAGGQRDQFSVSNVGVITSTAAATFKGITNTTSNTATSTLVNGCYQSYATSTATALKLYFTASTTAPTNGSGVIPVVSYGTCP